MSTRLRARLLLLAALALVVLSACGSGSGGAAATKKDPSKSTTSAPPSASGPACPSGAKCFDFADKSSGWPETNEADHFANQDPYLGGSYRIGGRASGTWNITAPVKVTELADDYGVQIDADVVPGQNFPPNAAWGASCWTSPLQGSRFSGFGVYVQPSTATIGLWDQYTGAFKPLKGRDVSAVVKPGQKNHLSLSCVQAPAAGGAEARIAVQVNGSEVGSLHYANSVKNFGWKPADGVGLFVAGKGADAFYDNVVIAAAK